MNIGKNCDIILLNDEMYSLIEQKQKKDRDFERNLGAEIEIKLFKAMDGVKVITGTLAGLEDGEIVVETPEGEKRIPRKAAALVK